MTNVRAIAAILVSALLAGGCTAPLDPALVRQHQIQLQRMQTRIFDTNDKMAIARGVISALQDLNFIIAEADTARGTFSAKKFGDYPIEMTITIQPMTATHASVHVDARYNSKIIEDPATYQEFFSSLEKSLPVPARAVN